MKPELKQMYQKILLARARHPPGYRKLQHAQQVEAYNPVCGDQFKLFVDIDGYRIRDIAFQGYGCAISKASTSLLVEKLKGKTLKECKAQIQYFHACMDNREAEADDIYKALALSKNFPGRQQCALLSWEALEKFLKNL